MKRKFMLFCACLLINIGWAIAQSSEISGVVLSAENGVGSEAALLPFPG